MQMKRTLALVLAFVLLLGLLPQTVFSAAAKAENKENHKVPPADTPEDLPEIVDEETARKKGHTQRLRDEEGEHLNRLVFRNADGTKTMYVYDHPVKYRDEQGQIHDISLEIADTNDSAYPFRTRANSAVTEFPASLPDGITLSGNGVDLRISTQLPVGNTALNHFARRVDNNTIAYTYDANTTIEYALTYTGFKEEIVVSSYTGQTEYPFLLYTNGLNLQSIDDGYYLTDESGTIQAAIGDIIVFTADERNNTMGTLQVTCLKPGQIYGLTIVLDADYLADPATVYPIRIDPTVQLVYTDENPNAIEEKTIQSNNTTSGSNTATVIGKNSKGISRSLMKFPGMDFTSLEGSVVTSAVVTIRDLMCQEEAMTVTCYPFTGDVWTESSTQWSNLTQSWGAALSSNVISYSSGTQQTTAHRYCFDITSLAQQWVNGTADPAKGIIFRADAAVENASTTLTKTFGTSERASYRPTFEITYKYIGTPDEISFDVDEGSTITLTTHFPADQMITWESQSPSIATVDQNGIVTGHLAGKAIIKATCEEAAAPVQFTVYVTVPDGVYYIKNSYSNYYLGVQDAGIVGLVNVQQQIKIQQSNPAWLSQLWKVQHLGSGRYTIRPMHKLDKALDVTNNNVDIYTAGTSDTLSVPEYVQWKIERNSTGYVFRNLDADNYALCVEGGSALSGANIVVDTYSSTDSYFRWSLQLLDDSPSGAILYDTDIQAPVENLSRYIKIGDTKTLATLKLSAAAYSDTAITQSFYWYSSNASVATVDSNSGSVTGVSEGSATIYGRKLIEDTYVYVSFIIQVGDDYTTELITEMNFTFDDAILIKSVYYRVCAAYPNDSRMLWAWRTARVLGGVVYDDQSLGSRLWSEITGRAFTCSESVFYTEILGFTPEEYSQISATITNNHNICASQQLTDFAHMQITLSARLAYTLNKDGYLSNVGTLMTDEEISHLAGWLGDAVLPDNEGKPSMGNDDYRADLDAENVYQLILTGNAYIGAFNQYYNSLSSLTRAESFLSYISYDTVKNQIYAELVSKQLYFLMETAEEQGDYGTYYWCLERLNDEEYYISTIRASYPDTYDFLCSLRDGLSDMGDY